MKASSSHKLTSRTRVVLGLFVAMWLNLALQPCAMAFAHNQDHDCPKCPPTHNQAAESRDAQEINLKGEACKNGVADCGLFATFNYDGRDDQLNLSDYLDDYSPALSAVVFPAPAPSFPLNADLTLVGNYLPGVPIPLSILHCVYLK